MITTQTWERRLRRTLSKFGCRLHKLRGHNGEYTVTHEDDSDVRYFSSLLKLQYFVNDMEYRHAN